MSDRDRARGTPRRRRPRGRGPSFRKDKQQAVAMGNSHVMPALGIPYIQVLYSSLTAKPLPKKERHFARRHAIFLVRNLDRFRNKLRQERHVAQKMSSKEEDYVKGTHFTKKDVFKTKLLALKTSRSVKTRCLAEEDSELGKMARLAGVCREIFSAITAAKDEEGNFMCTDLYHLPSRKKHPLYYQMIEEPIDLTMIKNKILSGEYQHIDAFEKDMMKLFHNVETYCGKKSEMGERMRHLRHVYHSSKHAEMAELNAILQPEAAADCQSGMTSESESSENMQVSTPTMSVSSESDFSETSDNKDIQSVQVPDPYKFPYKLPDSLPQTSIVVDPNIAENCRAAVDHDSDDRVSVEPPEDSNADDSVFPEVDHDKDERVSVELREDIDGDDSVFPAVDHVNMDRVSVELPEDIDGDDSVLPAVDHDSDEIVSDELPELQPRDLFDIKKVNPLPNLLKYTQEGSFTKLFFYCPAVKALIKCNPDVGRRSCGNNGGMMILKTSDTGNHEVKNVLPFLPFMGKRLIVVTRADLVHLLENKEVVIKDLTEKLQKELESLDSGPVYFLYEPKGKNPYPKCAVLIWREKHQTFIEDFFYSRYDREHNLCGIDPNAVGEEEEEAEAEPV